MHRQPGRRRYFTQLDRNGHHGRDDDLGRFAALGIRAIRYPILWETHRPRRRRRRRLVAWPTSACRRCASLGVTPIVGLVHHGSGPRHTSLLDPGLRRLAWPSTPARSPPAIPWVERLDTGQRAPDHGPLHRPVRCLVPARPRRLALHRRAAQPVPGHRAGDGRDPPRQPGRQAGPDRRSRSNLRHGPKLPVWPSFYNERRWLGVGSAVRTRRCPNIRCGPTSSTAGPTPERHCTGSPSNPARRTSSASTTTSPANAGSTIGSSATPAATVGGSPESSIRRHRVGPRAGHAPRRRRLRCLQEIWERYGMPLAITEAHIDANREDQLRWLLEIWRGADAARDAASTSAR